MKTASPRTRPAVLQSSTVWVLAGRGRTRFDARHTHVPEDTASFWSLDAFADGRYCSDKDND